MLDTTKLKFSNGKLYLAINARNEIKNRYQRVKNLTLMTRQLSGLSDMCQWYI